MHAAGLVEAVPQHLLYFVMGFAAGGSALGNLVVAALALSGRPGRAAAAFAAMTAASIAFAMALLVAAGGATTEAALGFAGPVVLGGMLPPLPAALCAVRLAKRACTIGRRTRAALILGGARIAGHSIGVLHSAR